MSWLRFPALDRFSPFTRSPPEGSTTVSDGDYSYITNEDLKRHAAQVDADERERRDADTLRVREGRTVHVLRFPAHSIARGELRVEHVRDALAEELHVKPKRVEMHYRGRTLSDDLQRCSDLGLKNGSELLGSIDNNVTMSDSDDSEEQADVQVANKKKRKNRRARNKKQKQAAATSAEPEVLDVPAQQHRLPSPARPVDPLKLATPQEKLTALFAVLHSFEQDVQAFLKSPPADPAKREYEHKRLSETILTQVLLKTDAVETEGDTDARARRKELVKETQDLLKALDDANSAK